VSESVSVVAFDTGPLSHFAKQGWLGILRLVVGERRTVVPDTVVAELQAGLAGRAYLQLVLDAPWIEKRDLTSDDEIREFAVFASLLVAGDRNRGEAGVLAYAKANNALAIIDDGPGRKAARENGVRCRGTLGLLCDALREDHLTISLVSTVADHLIESEYRLPFKAGGFERWARDNGLIPP
jgi:predicted nucleic acid-binding protein